jgi:hypothetical protein
VTLCVVAFLSCWFSHELRLAAGGGQKPECLPGTERADLNADSETDISDAIYLLSWLFLGGEAPLPLCHACPVDDEFSRSVAGSFLVCAEGDASGVLLSTINADGTDAVTGDFDFRPTTFSRFRSPAHGAWRRAGDRQTQHVEIQFLYDDAGNLSFIKRLRTVANWPDTFEGYIGTWTAEVFDIEALTCSSVDGPRIDSSIPPVAVATGTVRAHRVKEEV